MLSKFITALLTLSLGCLATPHDDHVPQFRPLAQNPYKKIGEIPGLAGFMRVPAPQASFSQWLRDINLKKDRTVYKYDGTVKNNQSAQFAVLDISVGSKDLQQCADAVMRLRAEYLFSQKHFSKISFIDNDGQNYQFTQPYTHEHLINYLQVVFGMCGSASLDKQLSQRVPIDEVASGDVLIRGGFPGHAVIVVDVAVNAQGKKIYMLAQSYMPAQDIHILKNPVNGSAWYFVNDEELITTPEYVFRCTELRRF